MKYKNLFEIAKWKKKKVGSHWQWVERPLSDVRRMEMDYIL